MIKVLALDIYGTVLATDDPENIMPPRLGIEKLFIKCNEIGIKVVSSSDANIDVLKIELEDSGVDMKKFDNFYHLNQLPVKDFKQILKDYNIKPSELLVIGDSYKDEFGAKKVGAKFTKVAKYRGQRDNLDLSSLI